MPLSLAALPPGFSWLRPAYRPSDQEIDAYAHMIAHAEGYPSENEATRLRDEAELQLWIWRTENHRRTRSASAGRVKFPLRHRGPAYVD